MKGIYGDIMDIFLKVTLYATSKHEMLALVHRLIERIQVEEDDGYGQWRYEWTNIPKDDDDE